MAKIHRLFLLILIFSLLNACDHYAWQKPSITDAGEKKTLRVAILAHPLSIEKIGSESMGLEADLIKSFAKEFNYQVKWHVFKNQNIKQDLSNKYDIVAFRWHGYLPENFVQGPAYQENDILLICPNNSAKQTNVVVGLNAYSKKLEQNLTALNLNLQLSSESSLELYKKASQPGKEFCFISDSQEAKFLLPLFSNLQVKHKLVRKQPLYFAIRKSNNELNQLVFYWINKVYRKKELSRIKYNYSEIFKSLSPADIKHFSASTQNRLLDYAELFKSSGQEHNIPWKLIAAIGFQESHWNPDSVSYTGVKGLMMLTQDAAKHIGVENRQDPEQSIWGGSKYFRFLLDSQSKHIFFKDRLSFALAAYNIGLGNLRLAQKVTLSENKNPNSWKDVKSILPHLHKYTDLPVRGHEGVQFTERVLAFYEILKFKY